MLEELDYIPSEEVRRRCRDLGALPATWASTSASTTGDFLHPGRDHALGRVDQALAAEHQPRRRHPRPLRRHGPGLVQQAETSRHPRHQGVSGRRRSRFHSARWDYDYTGGDASGGLHKLADKRVALIGTGGAGIQLVPHLGRDAKQLYVFQRTPSSVDSRANTPTDPAWVDSLQPGWQEDRKRNFHNWSPFVGVVFGEPDLVCDFWTELGRNMSARIAASEDPHRSVSSRSWQSARKRDYKIMERLRRRIASIVEDPETAETLKTVLPVHVQAAVFERGVPAHLQSPERDAGGCVGVQGCGASDGRASSPTASSTRSIA